jgi:molecular chaperone DnaK
MKIGEVMYKAQQQAAGPGGPGAGPGAGPGDGPHSDAGGPGKPDDKVVDAEFEEVDDKKKSA